MNVPLSATIIQLEKDICRYLVKTRDHEDPLIQCPISFFLSLDDDAKNNNNNVVSYRLLTFPPSLSYDVDRK